MKKIMFNDKYGLTTAVLEGSKTMTRRIVSIPDTWHGIDVCAIGPDTDKRSLLLYDADEFLIEDRNTGLCGQVMPLYKIGEEVAVAQSYKDAGLDPKKCDKFQLVVYGGYPPRNNHGWSNKMFVRADLMPHQIRITNTRVERLQDISDEDCLREGIIEYAPCSECGSDLYSFDGATDAYYSPREAFAALIDKVSGKDTWKSNPYVFVYEFELVK